MSADIWLEDEHGDALDFNYEWPAVQNIANVHYGNNFNLTYNLTPMLKAAGMPSWKEMIGMPTTEAGTIWDNVVIELGFNPEKYRVMNPANGWGSYEQAIEVLAALVKACRQYPEAKIGGWL
jgi:hypothetical protein